MAIAILAWLICGIAAGAVASSKGRSAAGWGCFGFALGPVGLLIAACMDRAPTDVEIGLSRGSMRKCPACAEPIVSEAKKCRYCGEAVEPVAMPEQKRPWEIG